MVREVLKKGGGSCGGQHLRSTVLHVWYTYSVLDIKRNHLRLFKFYQCMMCLVRVPGTYTCVHVYLPRKGVPCRSTINKLFSNCVCEDRRSETKT